MANKNTKQRHAAARKSAKTGSKRVVSQNKARNMQMCIYHNTGGGSLTCHEPIEAGQPFKPYKRGPGSWVTK